MTGTLLLLILVALIAAMVGWRGRRVTTIYPPNVGLLYRDGRYVRDLEPGRHVRFDPFGRSRVITVSRAPLPVAMPEFTVLSKDQFSFRVALSPIVEVIDARAFTESQGIAAPNPYSHFLVQGQSHAALHSFLASAAHEIVAAHGLRELIADPALLANAVQQKLADAIPGARVPRVLMTSITLPPETRKMFTEVERSKIEAESALERARGEQASLRALANAARLIKDNPALANLRFLQTLEQAPGAKTFVLGSDAMLPMANGAEARKAR